jgi:hypothetical protein
VRYDTPVFFVTNGTKTYDPDKGSWSLSNPSESKQWANITNMGAQRQQEVFGDVKSLRRVIRLQRAYMSKYDYIRIGNNKFHIDTEHLPIDKQSLVVIQDG